MLKTYRICDPMVGFSNMNSIISYWVVLHFFRVTLSDFQIALSSYKLDPQNKNYIYN